MPYRNDLCEDYRSRPKTAVLVTKVVVSGMGKRAAAKRFAKAARKSRKQKSKKRRRLTAWWTVRLVVRGWGFPWYDRLLAVVVVVVVVVVVAVAVAVAVVFVVVCCSEIFQKLVRGKRKTKHESSSEYTMLLPFRCVVGECGTYCAEEVAKSRHRCGGYNSI